MVKYLKHLLYIIVPIIVGVILITIFNYFGIFNSDVAKVLKIIIILISTFISSYLLGNKSKNKGYLEGLKLGGMFVFILFIINIVLSGFKPYVLLYYLIIIITSILGSMIGINLKKK